MSLTRIVIPPEDFLVLLFLGLTKLTVLYPVSINCNRICQEIPRGYSRKRENVKVLTNSGEQRGQDQNDKNTTLKT